MAEVDVTVIGLRELVVDLERADQITPDAVAAIVGKGALTIKTDWRRRWSGHPHLPHLPAAITYDTSRRRDEIAAEVGPDKDRRQGALGNIIEFGSPTSAPIPGGLPALDAEAPRFEGALADLAARLMEGR